MKVTSFLRKRNIAGLSVLVGLVGSVGIFCFTGCQSEKLLPGDSTRAPAATRKTLEHASSPASADSPSNKVDPYSAFRQIAPDRIVAIGDIHGDLSAARRAMRLAGAIDTRNHWIGGNLVVVQTGDQIDRWNADRAVLDFFSSVQIEAEKKGGQVISLNGNHELMNVQGLFWVVKPEAFKEFLDIQVPAGWVPPAHLGDYMPSTEYIPKMKPSQVVKPTDPGVYQRAYAFSPGGPYGKILGKRPFFVIVNDTVFVHGGIQPEVLSSNLIQAVEETHQWMLGKIHIDYSTMLEVKTPIEDIQNDRTYSLLPADGSADEMSETQHKSCESLAEVLAALGVKRMVVGHQIQEGGISRACEGRVWRIDIGLSRGYGVSDHAEVLEIQADSVNILRETPRVRKQSLVGHKTKKAKRSLE